jgi:hypothetical protein
LLHFFHAPKTGAINGRKEDGATSLMAMQCDQQGFSNSILFAALCLCFNRGERTMTASQLMCRRFAPTDKLSRHYLCRLIKSGMIKAHLSRRNRLRRGKQAQKRELVIERPPIPDSMLSREIVRIMRRARTLLLNSTDHHEERDEMVLEVLGGECIEYSRIYGISNNLIILDLDPFNPKLQLLLLENELKQVFMLIWRSIKELGRENTSSQVIGFSELMETAYEFYLEYMRSDYAIPHYNRPKTMSTSRVAGILLSEFSTGRTRGHNLIM